MQHIISKFQNEFYANFIYIVGLSHISFSCQFNASSYSAKCIPTYWQTETWENNTLLKRKVIGKSEKISKDTLTM